MNIGPLESVVLVLALLSLLGPVLAGAYLAIRLNRRPSTAPTQVVPKAAGGGAQAAS